MIGIVILFTIALSVAAWATQKLRGTYRILILLAVACCSVGLYAKLGNFGLTDFPARDLHPQAAAHKKLRHQQRLLITFLQDHPNHCKGWQLLEKSYRALGHVIEANTIQKHVTSLCGTINS